MTSMKHLTLGLAAIALAFTMSSCQGALDDDISLYFDTFSETASASGVPSSGGSSAKGNSGSNQADKIAEKLVGKWICTKYEFIDEETETYNDANHYIIFHSDFTAEVYPYNLFEAEFRRAATWTMVGNSKIMFNNDEEMTYSIMTLNSSTLKLGWLEEGDIIEITTFRKAN